MLSSKLMRELQLAWPTGLVRMARRGDVALSQSCDMTNSEAIRNTLAKSARNQRSMDPPYRLSSRLILIAHS